MTNFYICQMDMDAHLVKGGIVSIIARQVNFGIIPSMITKPHLSPVNGCLNLPLNEAECSLCADHCPAIAITLLDDGKPQLDEVACSGCMDCLSTCPTDSWSLTDFDPAKVVVTASKIVAAGRKLLRVACSGAHDPDAEFTLPCHAVWDPLLLAVVAAEGVQRLQLIGLSACETCPRRHGAAMMQQTEHDYAILNQSVGVRLIVVHAEEKAVAVTDTGADSDEPARRIFFRNLLPSLAKGAATTAMHIGHATRYDPEQERSVHAMVADTSPVLPLRLRLFIRALPKLRASFTPLPFLPSMPMGAIQANSCCTACGACVEGCPTDALWLKPFGSKAILEFKPDCCIGCQHCVVHCPEQALTQLPGISLPAIAANRPRPLVMVDASINGENS